MNFGIRFSPQELQSIDSSTITGSYQLIGSTFAFPIVLLKVVNHSDEAVTISYDGVTDHDFCPAHSFYLYDISSNRQRVDGLQFARGDGVYVKGTAGTGNIYLTTFFIGPS